MRFFILALACVLLVPAASATGAGADILVPHDGCSSSNSYNSSSSSNAYSWEQHESRGCEHRTSYVEGGARDFVGPVASVEAGSGNASSAQQDHAYGSSYSSWSWGDNQSSSSGSTSTSRSADSWNEQQRSGRSATLDTAAGSARAFDGCSSSYASTRNSTSRQSSWQDTWDNRTYSGSESTYSRSWADSDEIGCATGIDAVAAGRDASVQRGPSCTYRSTGTWTSRDSSWSNEDFNGSYRESESRGQWSDTCRDGVTVSAEGQEIFAGSENACEGTNAYRESSGDAQWSSDSSCFSGQVVEGPDGLRVHVGDDSTSSNDCWASGNTTSCAHGSTSQEGAGLDWADAPLGPMQGDLVTVPSLPTLP